MAEWKHKDRHWIHEGSYQLSVYVRNVPFGYYLNAGQFGYIVRDFSTWLDYQCEEGWEVFKISRDFNGAGGTWCIFRKKE